MPQTGKLPKTYFQYNLCWIFTRSEFQGELLRLDLGDLLGFQLLSHVFLAVGDGIVLINSDVSTWVLNTVHRTISLNQGRQIITANRLGLAYIKEFL